MELQDELARKRSFASGERFCLSVIFAKRMNTKRLTGQMGGGLSMVQKIVDFAVDVLIRLKLLERVAILDLREGEDE